MDGLLVVVPVFTPKGQSVAPSLTGILEELRDTCQSMIVVAQGEAINLPANIDILHLEEPAGIWGAIHAADEKIRDAIASHGISMVLLNLAPQYYLAEDAHTLGFVMESCYAYHIVGKRESIGYSLGSYTRGLIECFLTILAEIITDRVGILRDGFSGLQAFSADRWLEWDWRWVERTVWGGALEAQLQTVCGGFDVDYLPIPHVVERTWASTLGEHEMRAVVSMLEQALELPVFQNIRRADVVRAAQGVRRKFEAQTWLAHDIAEDQTWECVEYYNEHVPEGGRRLPKR
ncbi:MAG: hypothetical protein HYT41_01955 [Candidatus Sungbacteria bacterium]|nr:hypothetical protein [Candidatus Sungbacteria bacterium]